MGKGTCLQKEHRRNLKGWADGAQEEILSKWVPPFMEAIGLGPIAAEECLNKCYDNYFTYIDPQWPNNIDPSDPKVPHVVESLTEEEEKVMHQAMLDAKKVCTKSDNDDKKTYKISYSTFCDGLGIVCVN